MLVPLPTSFPANSYLLFHIPTISRGAEGILVEVVVDDAAVVTMVRNETNECELVYFAPHIDAVLLNIALATVDHELELLEEDYRRRHPNFIDDANYEEQLTAGLRTVHVAAA